jgi:hypothetical protein
MIYDEEHPPPDVIDLRLWQDAQPVLRRHHQDKFPHEQRCAFCHAQWPCQPRTWADQADRAARIPVSIRWPGGANSV